MFVLYSELESIDAVFRTECNGAVSILSICVIFTGRGRREKIYGIMSFGGFEHRTCTSIPHDAIWPLVSGAMFEFNLPLLARWIFRRRCDYVARTVQQNRDELKILGISRQVLWCGGVMALCLVTGWVRFRITAPWALPWTLVRL